MKIEDTRIVLTGASRGLGEALARALSKRGAKLLLVGRTASPLEAVAKQTGAHAFAFDVGKSDAALAIAAAAQELLGGVDVLIHNASVLGPVPLQPLLETSEAAFREALEVNLLGPFRLTKAVAGAMALKHSGVVVSITSDAATNAYPTWGAYGVSKAGLEHLTRIWAAELEGSGVKFMTFDPGEMDTQMHADAMPEADRASLARPAAVAEKLVSQLEALP